ncbi:MAG: endolytic transglycosylase MltG [Treponema sp.]|nr:endolytic transglycosylase MltG [Treponema sp.]
MKRISIFLCSLLFLVILIVGGSLAFVYSQSRPVISKTSSSSSSSNQIEKTRIEIHSGDSVKKTALLLKEKNLIKNDMVFYAFARKPELMKFFFKNTETENSISNFVLKSGMYYVSPDMDIPEILSLLSSGQQEYVSVSIPEGWTISKIGNLLEEKEICPKEDFIKICHDTNFLIKNHISLDSAEGFLFPDTYFFIPNSDAEKIASEMITTFYKKISTLLDVNSITQKELEDIVILSSIVEREYRVAEEAPLIASVFKNRLRHNIGLYSCATVVYVLTEIEGRPHPSRILIEDTKIDSPYNTYKWAGLPPGAISNPGLTSLNAVINAPKTNYYFFQVKDVAKGTHVFTSTFDEHVENHNLTTK